MQMMMLCGELFVEGDSKVRDNDHVTGKHRGSAHKDCHIFLDNKMIPVIFHDLRGYDSHSIKMQEIGKLDMKIDIPKELEK